jgi:hypothetical protein
MIDEVMIAAPDETHEAVGTLQLRVADLSLRMVNLSADLRLGVDGAARRFVVDDEPADVNVQVSWGDLSDERDGEMLFDSGRLWQLFNEDGRYRFKFTSKLHPDIPYKVARFNSDFTSGEVRLHRPYFDDGREVYPLEYPLDELLLMNLLARGRGAEVHSCGVVDRDGRGLLFVGQSQAGKTTTARLWEGEAGVRILSDDRIIIRKEEGKFWMYGTPWHGEAELAAQSKAELTRIFFLRQARENRLDMQRGASAAARLLACGFPTFYDPVGLEFTSSFLDELTQSVPCYELSFVKDETAVDFVRREMS